MNCNNCHSHCCNYQFTYNSIGINQMKANIKLILKIVGVCLITSIWIVVVLAILPIAIIIAIPTVGWFYYKLETEWKNNP